MPDTGFVVCGTGADDNSAGTSVWTNPGNITTVDGVFATTPLAGGTSRRLKGTNFGFSNATHFGNTTGNTILGIELRVTKKGLTAGAIEASVLACKAGTPGGTDKSTGAVQGTTNVAIIYGGAADLWGQSWAQTDFVGVSAFGFVTQFSAGGATTMDVDSYECRITYQAGTSPIAAAGSESDTGVCAIVGRSTPPVSSDSDFLLDAFRDPVFG